MYVMHVHVYSFSEDALCDQSDDLACDKIMGCMIVDEKTVDTAHVAIGSNAWFGGSVLSCVTGPG